MDIYNRQKAREKIKEILDSSYEKMYPFEIEKELGKLFRKSEENKDEEIKQEIKWEIDLLNRTFGHRGTYQGKEVDEISNKWQWILGNEEFRPFSNIPFCEWKEESVEYYKKRYEETKSNLSKARYAFAILIFSKSDRISWMEKSVEGWLKTAEKYIDDTVYNKEYYEVPPFAYEFALKLSLKFGKSDFAKKILDSLHQNIIKILESGEKRWHLEFFEVESKYIHDLKDVDEIKKESVEKLKEIIDELRENFLKSQDKNRSNHFLRHHVRILSNYQTEDKFSLEKEIAESYILEAEVREDPLVRSVFLEDAIKKYKLMQSEYSGTSHKKDIDSKIEELTMKIKGIGADKKYKSFESNATIRKEDIRKIIRNLKGPNVFQTLLTSDYFIPRYGQSVELTKRLKKDHPLGFITPNIISRKDITTIKHSSEEEIFDYKVRQNILIGIKIGGVMIKMSLEELRTECNINSLEEAKNLILEIPEIEDIRRIIERGLIYTLGEKKDIIAGIHILIPYFEEIIRRILEKLGKKDLILESKKEKFFRKVELSTLLSDEIVKGVIGEDFQATLKVLLVDNDQLNLRQDLAHGLLTTDIINEEDTLYVVYCLLRLIFILKNTNPFSSKPKNSETLDKK